MDARFFDTIEQQLLPAVRQAVDLSDRADFRVGYFNLRGWKRIASNVGCWPGGEGNRCRLLIEMRRLPQDELHDALSLVHPSTLNAGRWPRPYRPYPAAVTMNSVGT